MARVQSFGTVLYRDRAGELEVLLVHPSGAYNRGKPWSIPKGLAEEGESPEAAARRETLEETGVEATDLVPLGHIDYQKSKKRIFAFAGRAGADAAPRCASWEVDAAEFMSLANAFEKLHPDQRPFLERLSALIV